ncbi:glyoxylase-like metal-dependent hydrolase (beta-lactamase superfamily II) [Collimonas sp. PA-H2]|uniref:MBL fold metallo-hydrolase n=1 Tax=Collimonas sp. PA-H2 TaxID=1881062 RepID=UPI000C0107D0|nr:MBL fold metallo-hydrolase [Collimonas sp. PA-H2]PFH07820.1 glyoxylase-like metal-dependent hydrolase (beta-lactamase superfamily II) [Collimonas sp. PA-H2]
MKVDSTRVIKQVGKVAIIVATALVAMTTVTQNSYAQAPMAKFQAPGFYRTMLGDFEVTVVSDGTALRHVDEIMSKPEKVREAYSRNGEELPTELSINTFLINTGSKLILVDTGAGELFGGGSSGRLVNNLRAAGYQPEQVDAILLTHIHGDHSGGLSVGGKRVFPNADVYVDKNDSDYWLSEEKANAAPSSKRTTFMQSRATVNPYVDAKKLKPFVGAQELFPGISSIPAYGHTPGHTAYLIGSRGKKLLLWGDVIHAGDVQFKDPDVTIAYDFDPVAAVKSRQHLFQLAATNAYLVGGAHISFPGLGHVASTSTGYEWVTAPYQIQGTL